MLVITAASWRCCNGNLGSSEVLPFGGTTMTLLLGLYQSFDEIFVRLRGSRLLVHSLRDWACFRALLSHVFQLG